MSPLFPLLVAHDAGPSAALAPLLLNEGWQGCLLNAGKVPTPSEEQLRAAIADASVVIVGMSSEKTATFEQLACTIAVELEKPLVFFCDTFGCYVREWFAPWREHVRAVFVVTPADIPGAEKMYPTARVVALGNPAWETFFTPALEAEGNRIRVRGAIGVGATEKMLFISGTKDPDVNKKLLGGAIDAANDMDNVYLHIVFSQHPGDKTEARVYEQFAKADTARVSILPSTMMRGDAEVFGADFVLTYNAASLAVMAVVMRWILIHYCPPLAQAQLLSESGSIESPLVVAGAALDGGTTPASLHAALKVALSPKCNLREAQEAFLPSLRRGDAARKMTETIEEIASR